MAMLELRDITRTVTLPNGEDLHILRGINLDINAGDHISIVGHSGTGKSTLLNIIGMLDLPTSGTYTWDGKDMLKLKDAQRSKIRGASVGFVFQQFNLFGMRDVLNNVEVPLLYNSGKALLMRHSLAAKMLEEVGLADRLHAMPSQLSGGEQQRVAIARALIRQPKLILADEPTGALDPDTGSRIMDLLERSAEENGAALIVITHDMGVAKRADRVYEISQGVLHDASHLPESLLVNSVPLSGSQLEDTVTPEPADTVTPEPDAASVTHDSEPSDIAQNPDPSTDIDAPASPNEKELEE